jgi:hypothetical protein
MPRHVRLDTWSMLPYVMLPDCRTVFWGYIDRTDIVKVAGASYWAESPKQVLVIRRNIGP